MRFAYVIAACALGSGLGAAQTQAGQRTNVVIQRKIAAQPAAPAQLRAFVSAEFAVGRVVKGAPYSAQSISEFEQTLADGNRIFRSNSGMVYRDSEGRTRREQPIGGIGLLGPAADLPSTIVITDPVAGFSYMLNPQDKTVVKMPLPPEPPAVGGGGGGVIGPVTDTMVLASPGTGPGMVMYKAQARVEADPANFRTEQLGTRAFDSVQAEGTRTVTTIPAGQIGNERPIESVSERWYSQQLQATVLSQHSDPRTGTTTERLSGINLAEPSPSLFEIPPDYTVKENLMARPVRILRDEPKK